jgi:uncharacterized DUF497 family protein
MPFFDRFTWDPSKNEDALQRKEQGHRDFNDLTPAFLNDQGFIAEDDRRDYGERRFWMFNRIGGLPYRITFTMRGLDGGETRIISGHIIGDEKLEQADITHTKHALARLHVTTEAADISAAATVSNLNPKRS